jgi:hypothetical protein
LLGSWQAEDSFKGPLKIKGRIKKISGVACANQGLLK